MKITSLDKVALAVAGVAVGVAALATGPRSTFADDTPRTKEAPATTRKPGAAEALARAIDAHVDARLAKANLTAAPQADDAEFLRRASIDLAGVPPTPDEVVTFLADQDPAKREKKVDELLARPESVRHWAEIWTDIVEGDSRGIEGNKETRVRIGLRDFFQDQLGKSVPFDEITRKLLTADGFIDENGAAAYFMAYGYDAKFLAATTSRTFMHLQIECAQCHDHPFADWKQEQFMGMAAFFARVRQRRYVMKDEDGKKKMMPRFGVEEAERGELVLNEKNEPLTPEEMRKLAKELAQKGELRKLAKEGGMKGIGKVSAGKRVVDPAFIVPAVASTRDASLERREALARMITDPRNPYYRPAIANKVWAVLTGRALISATDDLSDKASIKDPELLAILARGFSDVKHDMRDLVRAIAKSKVYGRSSRGAQSEELDASYGKSIVRPIDGRPLARTLVAAMFLGEQALEQGRKLQEEQILSRFEKLFGETNLDPKKYEESIPQALKVMNQGPLAGGGKRAARALPIVGGSPQAAMGRLLSRYDAPRERITRIYLASVSRPPRKAELDTALEFLMQGGESADCYEDLLWALVNSSEFRFNR